MHDELRRLDEDLAAGRLDADSYRRRRDELLAARPPAPAQPVVTGSARVREGVADATPGAAAAGPDGSGPNTSGPSTSGVDGSGRDRIGAHGVGPDDVDPDPDEDGPDEGGPGGVGPGGDGGPAAREPAGPGTTGAPGVRDPFPPPFRWDGASEADASAGAEVDPAGSAPDSTQVVAAWWAAGEEPERTQVVRGGAGGPAGAADATQVVGFPRVPDPRLGPGRPGTPAGPPERTQFVPGAALTRAGDLRSVPARRTVPPWVDERSVAPADARRPGREVFARRRGPSPAAVIGTTALVLVVLVVLALSFLLG